MKASGMKSGREWDLRTSVERSFLTEETDCEGLMLGALLRMMATGLIAN